MSSGETKRVSATPKRTVRRWGRIAHLWAGLILGLWLVMLGLTGSALVYQHSLRQILEQGRKIRPGLSTLSIDELLARVHQQRPDLRVLDISGMDQPDSAWELLVRPVNATRPEKHSRVLLVDPGTGEIGAMQAFNGTFMGFLAQLHDNLLSGEIGLTIKACRWTRDFLSDHGFRSLVARSREMEKWTALSIERSEQ